jgi:glutamate 5-kinase
LVIVSSGAIALGARRLGLEKGGRANLADAQAAASVGQIALAGIWSDLLAAKGLTAAQMLLTLDDFEDRRRYLNAAATLSRLLEAGAVPVINENDSVATSEIRFGDNDRLAARVAQAAGAQGVVLLSDIDGLYDRNPADEGAVHLPEIRELTDDVRAMADGSSASGMGSGGMAVKLEAARIACLAGIPLAIISGKVAAPLTAWEHGARGTLFHPQRSENARKSWLGARQSAAGSVSVDVGAVGALGRGSSLLPAGVTAVDGVFARGDVVDILDPDGVAIARGLAEYDAAEARAIMGLRKEDIAEILGYAPRSALIHRDQLVLL